MVDLYVCSYEKYMIGYHFGYREEPEDDDEYTPDGPKFQLLFRDQSALGSLRCIAASSRLLACAGTDETIYSFEMLNGHGKESGAHCQHTGTVTCLALHENKFLISGGEDGRLCIWDCCSAKSGLNLLKQFLIKHSFLSIAVHEVDGKVALTLDSGGYLKVWDLYKCCLAYSLPLKSKPHTVKWFSPNSEYSNETCDRFVVLSNCLADIRNLESGESIASFSIKNRGQLTCIDFINKYYLIAGTTMGDLIFMSTKNGKLVDIRQAHQGRIKGLAVIGEEHGTANWTEQCSWTLFSASSDGFLKAWKIDLKKLKLSLISLVDVRCRITDLAAVKFKPRR